MTAFSAVSVRNEIFLFFAVFHETLFFVMKISLYRQFLITGLFWIMKISRTWQFFIILHQTRLAFIMNISCIVEKFITSRQHRPALKKKIVRNCQYQEIFITKNKLKKEKWWKSTYIRKYSLHIIKDLIRYSPFFLIKLKDIVKKMVCHDVQMKFILCFLPAIRAVLHLDKTSFDHRSIINWNWYLLSNFLYSLLKKNCRMPSGRPILCLAYIHKKYLISSHRISRSYAYQVFS